MTGVSFKRFLAVLRKEFIQIRRDPLTLRMIIALPVLQLFLFGYAINADPKHLPTGLLSADHSKYERTLIAAECVGDGYWFIDKVAKYVKERNVFGRPIGQNQGVQFPIAKAYIKVEAANLMRFKACTLFDAHQPCGAEANMALLLAAEASWEAANACLQFHGGFGFACEYDVERKFRETRLYQVAPISTNLILSYVAEHVLGLPRSF